MYVRNVHVCRGMYALTTWLFKSRRAPWHTARLGQGWKAAGQRYLAIASWLPQVSVSTMALSVVILAEAEKADTLQEIFGESILKE